MPENKGEVEAFQFDKDSYDVMEKIYVSILNKLGEKDAYGEISKMLGTIPDDQKNGVMFNKIVSGLFKGDDQKRKDTALEVFEQIKNDKDVSPYVKAYIAKAAIGYIPYDTVLTAARMVGGERGKNGKSLQMGCGEGKTGVLSMASTAILNQDKKRQVFLTSSTEDLAGEALDEIEFYDLMGFAKDVVLIDSEGITKPVLASNGKAKRDKEGKIIFQTTTLDDKSESVIKKELKDAYSSRLVISDNVTLMQDTMKGYMDKPISEKPRELLADEADFVLLDSYRPLQRTTEMSAKDVKMALYQRKIAYELLEKVKKEMPDGLFVRDISSQYVDFTPAGRELVIKSIKDSQKTDEMDLNRLYDYVYDALVVDTVYKENRDYTLHDLSNPENNEPQEIILKSEDRNAGVAIDLPEGVKQALEIKLQKEGRYNGKISKERKVIDTLNTHSFFDKQFNGTKHFISGTLGADSEAIQGELKDFGVSKEAGDIYVIPPKEKARRIDKPKRFCKDLRQKRNIIIKSAIAEIKAGRPVLIGAVSEEEINALKAVFAEKDPEKTKNIRLLEFTAASEDIFKRDKERLDDTKFKNKYGVEKDQYKNFKTLIKNESGKENTITFGTSIIGRGTTIKTSKEINDAGGIHVIIDGLHETSSRNQDQYKARTARGDNNGSTQEIFCPEDIPEDFRRKSYDPRANAEEIYKEVYEQIDARASNIRRYVVKFVETTLEKQAEIDAMPGMSPERKQQAKALLTQRAFAIKNRACGVSDKFQSNIQQYEREIEAYKDLYIAKYMVTDERYFDGNGFDEVKWLEENDYEDIAKTHMPFSESRQKEIFKYSDINMSKIKKEPIQDGRLKINKKNASEKAKTQKIEENSEPISDKEAEPLLQPRMETIMVDDSFKDKQNQLDVRDEEISRLETAQLNVDVRQMSDELVELNQKADKSLFTKLGIKNLITDEKNIEQLTTSKIKQVLDIVFRWAKNRTQNNVEKNVETSELLDTAR